MLPTKKLTRLLGHKVNYLLLNVSKKVVLHDLAAQTFPLSVIPSKTNAGQRGNDRYRPDILIKRNAGYPVGRVFGQNLCVNFRLKIISE